MTDIFEEVEEEVRRAHYEALWKNYGQYLIALAVAIVVGIAGWQWYQNYERGQRAAVSNAYQSAQALAGAGKFAEAEKAFAVLADTAPAGYRMIARFRQAAMLQYQNKNDAAATIYAEIAASDDADLAANAKLRMAWIHAESAPRATVEKDVEGLSAPSNPWRFAATEVLAYSDLRRGTKAQAISLYNQLANDSTAPQGIRIRASAILEYLSANPDENPVTAAAAAGASGAPAVDPAPTNGQEKSAQ